MAGASERSTKYADSPLNGLRLKANLTVKELAERFGVSVGAISRWLSGERTAPVAFVDFLCRAAAGDASEIAAAQKAFRQARRRASPPPPMIELALPEGLDPAEARRLCVAALADARREVRVARGAGL